MRAFGPWVRRTALFSVGLLFTLAAASCKADDEALISQLIRRSMEAANEKNVGGVVADAAETFSGPRGADLFECRRILIGLFSRAGWLRVFERRIEVTLLNEVSAKAEVEVALVEGRQVERLEDLMPTDATVLVFSLTLAKQNGDWELTRAEYRRAPP